jgi:Ca-activated chloride channel family protein
MAGPKMEQAKKALRFCLANLNDGDRFEIVRFSTESEKLFGVLQSATKDNLAKAQTFVDAMKPIGGTAIADALKAALTMPMADAQPPSESASRPYVVIFLTDGQPTVGETNEDKLVQGIHVQPNMSLPGTRIFSFGIGTDVNTHLLDRIANDTKAFSQYVLPEEDIEVKVSTFYSKIKEPVLSNVALAFTGDVKTTAIYPGTMPDLFKGETLIAFGKYSGKGAAAVKITGMLNGEKREFVNDVSFADQDAKNDFIPRLWATRRVG